MNVIISFTTVERVVGIFLNIFALLQAILGFTLATTAILGSKSILRRCLFLLLLVANDTLTVVLSTVISVVTMSFNGWMFGEALCWAYAFVIPLLLCNGWWQQAFISLQRFVLIVYDKSWLMSQRVVLLCNVLSLLISLLLVSPRINILVNNYTYPSMDENSKQLIFRSASCIFFWQIPKQYRSITAYGGIALPLLISVILYLLVSRKCRKVKATLQEVRVIYS